MPRPPVDERARNKNFVVRLLPEEREELDRIAAKDRLSASDAIRQMIRTHASADGADDGTISVRIGGYTVIHDLDENASMMRVEGLLPMPVGSEIELDGGASARVERVRLLCRGSDDDAMHLCLDVRRIDGPVVVPIKRKRGGR